ncbi:ABC transporter ATP-binding protein, partial [Salmonella enterica]
RIEQVGSPQQLYHHPANRFVAGFIGSPKMNFIEGTVAAVQADGVQVQLPGGGLQWAAVDGSTLQAGEKVTLGVRPEHLNIAQGQ